MADNLTIKDGAGNTKTIATDDVSDVHTPRHILTTDKTIIRASVDVSALGDNTLIAALADVRTKVLGIILMSAATVTVTFQDGAGGSGLAGAIILDASIPFTLNIPANPDIHWMETSVNTLLNLSLGGAVQVSGLIVYYQEA